ncbi:MAG: hypothetical protein EA362_01200 [Saprospirales bacterium]|nr:MAG: hypothetical protein EA362_01200 [Saprospirales bacterium]
MKVESSKISVFLLLDLLLIHEITYFYVMIIIADCGGTSCDWKIFTDSCELISEKSGPGINLTLASEVGIQAFFRSLPLDEKERKFAAHLFFFGAGSNSNASIQLAENELKQALPNCNLYWLSDLELVARALAGKTESICCILGTGANVAWWTGSKLVKYRPALGYILGDECSGAWFGKRILKDYFYGQLPEELGNELAGYLPEDSGLALRKIYSSSTVNALLAGVFGRLSKSLSHPYMQELINEGLMEFFYYHVHSIPACKCAPIHFGGSVAEALSVYLKDYCSLNGYLPPVIAAKPLSRVNEEVVLKLVEDFNPD